MAILNQKKILNLIPKVSAPVTIHVSQGDVGTVIEFTLVKGDEVFSNTGNLTASVHGVREDGANFGPFTCTLSGSKVTFPLHSEMTAVKGSALAEIVLVDNDGNKVGSANFAIMVEESVFPLGVTYDNDVSVYESILAYVQTISAQVTLDYNTKIDAEIAARQAADLSEATTRAAADTALGARIDNIVAPSGEAPSAAEVEDARVGADGTTYNSLGTAIRTQIENVETLIDVMDNEHLIASYDKTVFTISNTYLNRYGEEEVGSSWSASDFIQLSNNLPLYLYFKLYGSTSSATQHATNIAFYTEDEKIVYGAYLDVITAGTEYERYIQVPSNAHYIRMCTRTEYLDDARISIYKKGSEIITENTDIFYENIIHDVIHDTREANGYLNTSGNFVSAPMASWCTSDYIDCSNYDYCKYNLITSSNTSMIALFDANKELIKNYVLGASSYHLENGNINIESASYIRVCTSVGTDVSSMYCKLYKKGASFIHKINYHDVLNKPYDFNNKSAYFFGDSIVVGYTQSGNITSNNWAKLLCDDLNMTMVNKAVGGASFYPVSGYSDVLTQLQNTNLSGADFVFIGAGINDWQLKVNPENTRDAVEDVCEYLTASFNGEVIFVLPINEGGKAVDAIATLDEYRTAIGEVVTRFEYGLINGKYFNFPTRNDAPSLIAAMYGDKLHPSELGYRHYEKAMKTRLC